jgi:hypothetical protein
VNVGRATAEPVENRRGLTAALRRSISAKVRGPDDVAPASPVARNAAIERRPVLDMRLQTRRLQPSLKACVGDGGPHCSLPAGVTLGTEAARTAAGEPGACLDPGNDGREGRRLPEAGHAPFVAPGEQAQLPVAPLAGDVTRAESRRRPSGRAPNSAAAWSASRRRSTPAVPPAAKPLTMRGCAVAGSTSSNAAGTSVLGMLSRLRGASLDGGADVAPAAAGIGLHQMLPGALHGTDPSHPRTMMAAVLVAPEAVEHAVPPRSLQGFPHGRHLPIYAP